MFDVGFGFLYIAFIMFRYVPVIPVLFKIFIMKLLDEGSRMAYKVVIYRIIWYDHVTPDLSMIFIMKG
ncbi:hypothetical protein H671_2g6504 [Cricetulus griseus]|uniref:Uncharacterized protein n=1 Tax=Cricetulus griseus TaxID=10029 RepID=A0A061ID07_CRIGR|nr:hypothetical protein H671_2g6504 [Cricetulus griseus]